MSNMFKKPRKDDEESLVHTPLVKEIRSNFAQFLNSTTPSSSHEFTPNVRRGVLFPSSPSPSQAELKRTQFEISQSRTRLEQQQIMFEKERKELEKEIREKDGQLSHVEKEKNTLFEMCKDLKDKLEKSQAEYEKLKNVRNQEKIESNKVISMWNEKFVEAKEETALEKKKFMAESLALKEKINFLEQTIFNINRQSPTEEKIESIQPRPPQVDEQEVKILREQLKKQMSYIEKTERQNRLFQQQLETTKERLSNAQLAEEKILALQVRIDRYEAMKMEFIQSEQEKEKLKEEQMKWKAFLEHSKEFESPHQLVKLLADCKMQLALAVEKQGDLLSHNSVQREENIHLTESLKQVKESEAILRETIVTLKESLSQVTRSNATAQKEIQLLKEQLNSNCRILHLKDNPTSAWLLNSHQTESKDLRVERLKQVFRAKVTEFREAVFALLGYKVDMLENNRIRLLSIYSFDQLDVFIFERMQDGSFVLVDTEYANQWKQECDLYLGRGRSVPAFFSAVTLSLWERSTMAL